MCIGVCSMETLIYISDTQDTHSTYPSNPVSGINSAHHKLAGAISRILTLSLGTIIAAHIKHSGDLIKKIRYINMTNISMASLVIKSLYTNLPITKCLNILRNYLKTSKENFPLPVHEIIKIHKVITKNCYSSFNKIFNKQNIGLLMGSRIIGVLPFLFLESIAL